MNTTPSVIGSKTTNVPPTGGVNQTTATQTQSTTGTGVVGQPSVVPDQATPTFANVIQQLRTFLPKSVVDDFEATLAKATSKLKDAIGGAQESRANNEMTTKSVAIKENQATIEESKKKLDEAEAKKKSGNIIDILSLVFQAIGAALAAVVAAVAIATGVGVAAGAALIAVAALAFVSLANSITAEATNGTGIAGSIAKAAGADETAVAVAEGVFAAGLVIATLALLPVAMSKNPMGTIQQIKESLTTAIKTLGQAISTVVSTLDAGAQIGRAGLNMSATVDRTEASKLRAESSEMQAMMQKLDEIIDMALTLLMRVNGNINAILDKYSEILKDTGDTVANTRFAG